MVSDGNHQRKIAAIGVKIAGGVAYHGFAINVDLDMFDGIVPCGITDRGVTSMVAEYATRASMDAVANVAAREFCDSIGLRQELVR